MLTDKLELGLGMQELTPLSSHTVFQASNENI